MKVSLSLVVVTAFILSGCVKVQLFPEDAVKNTFKAGKNIYDESKLKKQGGKRREYSSQVSLSDFSSKNDAELSCIEPLRRRLISESKKKAAVILSERVILVDGMENDTIECQIIGFVWPNS